MPDPKPTPIKVSGYHAHVYYNTETKPTAERLAEAIGRNFTKGFLECSDFDSPRRRHESGFGFGGGRFGGHHRGGGRGGRLGRVFDHGDLRYVLLQLIAEKPRHGYELIKAIEEKFGGTYSPSPGSIYPTLTLLEELGYLRVGNRWRHQKALLDHRGGHAFLAANRPSSTRSSPGWRK